MDVFALKNVDFFLSFSNLLIASEFVNVQVIH